MNYKTIYLKDYQPPAFSIETVDLEINLDESKTRVKSKLLIVKNKQENNLILNGEKLKLISIKLNEQDLLKTDYVKHKDELIIKNVPNSFSLEIENEISPKTNTELSGLYTSNNIFCTQCESEGFRRITYFMDRPDVMSRFTTTIVADKARYPILLSNGNRVGQGELSDNKHWVKWEDPFKKPSYLFALVAGDLDVVEDHFITQSKRKVLLQAYVEKGNREKCIYALECLKKAMHWDEVRFGREYDLDLYMIVAISDFNMGAMENKGLNIFNTKYILANSEIATDHDYEAVLEVIGHEYFHNWTGNRITCRDWFQLSLKEGLTIFRDQEFTAEMTSPTVKRIEDVDILRTYQFSEDKGPMAHPVRPDSYIEINNFYTTTIYQKGAEVIRMIQTILGKEGFRKGMDLYFERHDGQAVTIEDFVKAMEDANNENLTQFRLWYSQAGTPLVQVERQYDSANKTYTLNFTQSCPPTPGQSNKQPLHIPIKMALLDGQGHAFPLQLKDENPSSSQNDEYVLNLKQQQESFTFKNIAEKPILSLLHDFSAPIILQVDYQDDELSELVTHSKNLFSRWEAMQTWFHLIFEKLSKQLKEDKPLALDKKFVEAMKANLNNKNLDKSFIATMLTLPSEKCIANMQEIIDIESIHAILKFISEQIAFILKDDLIAVYQENSHLHTYEISHEEIAKRELKNTCLSYLMQMEEPEIYDICLKQFNESNNMTDRLTALDAIADSKIAVREDCLHKFYQKWQQEPLVVDKWFAIQATADQPLIFEQVNLLAKHPAFNLSNPNRVRSLISAFCHHNLYHFHRKDGQAYAFLTNFVAKINKLNPQLAARLLESMIHWRRYDKQRKKLMHEQLTRIADMPHLSKDVYELVTKSLAEASAEAHL